MRKLGISIYPNKSSVEEMKQYIDDAAQAGFTRIFSNLLAVDQAREEVVKEFADINNYAKSKGFEIIMDVAPSVFKHLGITYQDLSFFKEINADGFRLDEGFGGSPEAMMTYNPEGLLVEINMSQDLHYIDTIMDYQPNQFNLIGCHNFYPHPYSGLEKDFFLKTTHNFKKHGLRTAAFVTAQNEGSYGPWPVTDGLPTLDMHRYLPLDVQIKHFIAMNAVDDIIISNCFPSKEELDAVAKVNQVMVNFQVELVDNIPDIERSIVLDELHFNRGDVNGSMIRSTMPRVKHKGHQFDVFNAPEILKRGDIVIESSLYGHYAGELQVVKKEMKNSGKTNVVGRIREVEHFMLDDIKPWQKFKLTL